MLSVAHQENQGLMAMRLRHDVGTRFNKGSVVVVLVSWLVVLVFGAGWAGCVKYRVALRGARVTLRRCAFVSHPLNQNQEFHDTSAETDNLCTISSRQNQAT